MNLAESTGGQMNATRIMIIRHAEKPGKDGPPYGVDVNGNPHEDSLSTLGWQRAGALTVFFAPSRGPLQSPAISVPNHIFACGKERDRLRLRPLETVALLAEWLETTVNSSFIKGQEAEVADLAMSLPGVVLISWEHKNIHLIANRIAGNTAAAPQAWPAERFDVVWVFDLVAGSYRFSQIPQLLLPGDSEDVI